MAALGFLLMVSLVVSAGLTALGVYLNSILPFGSLILSVLNFIVSLALLSVLFAAIYKILPDRPIAWRDVVVGAVVTAVLFTAGKSLIGWYLGSSAIASSYGAAGGLILLLLWIYSAQIFLLGAEFTKAYATRHGSALEGTQGDDSRLENHNVGTKAIPTSSIYDDKSTSAATAERQMATTNGQSPSFAHLEREAERDRQALVNTVEALQERMSPTAIKRDVQEYVRDKKEGILRNLEQRARENPLQAVAIAAGAAYPLWRIVTSIPAPLLLIGAGLALTRTSKSSVSGTGAAGQGFAGEARDRLGEATDAVKQKFEEVSGSARQSVQQTMQAARAKAGETSARIADLKSEVSKGTESLTAKAGETLSHAADTVRTMSSDAVSAASDRASAGYRGGLETASRAGEQMRQTGQRAHETFAETVQRHPMVVGAVGLAIGAIIAAALPVTRQEEQLLGEAGSELKKKAQGVASEGFDAVKGAAQEVYEDTVAYAREQGLSPDGMREAAANVGQKVKEVIAKAKDSSTGESGGPDDDSPQKALSRR